jgi:DNA (cytosine-5)-methyltransferase 1
VRFLSVCSGIEAASVAFNPLGWEAIGFSEIEPFPCKLLAHYYPDIPNHGDMTLLPEKILNGDVEAPDMLVGGTPCQAFSYAGKRLSLEDLRGNLTLTFSEIANAIDSVRLARGENPSIIFWENVPGVLSTKDNAFGCFLGALAGEDCELKPAGGKWTNAGCVFGHKRTVAWRVLDAQYFGVAQRRRRVFVVASARDDISPPEILFEFDGVRRDSAPSREERKEVARTAGEGFTASSFAGYREGVGTLRSNGGDLGGSSETIAVIPFNKQRIGQYSEEDIASTCAARDYKDATDLICCVHGTQDPCTSESTAFALGRNNGQENAVCYALQGNMIGRKPENGGNATEPMHDIAPCQTKTDMHAVACFSAKDYGADVTYNLSPTLRAGNHNTSHANSGNWMAVHVPPMSIRRLTPIECERLQGFPDSYTDIKPNGKPTPDGPRYKALGNSWAVPVVRWIGMRIQNALKATESHNSLSSNTPATGWK